MYAVTVDPDENVWMVFGKNRFAFGGPQLYLGRFADRPLAVAPQPGVPLSVALYQNYPNPFNPSTTIRFALSHRLQVTLSVYNAPGEQVNRLINGDMDAGDHEVSFEGSRLASGLYFYRIQAGNFVQTKKLLLIH